MSKNNTTSEADGCLVFGLILFAIVCLFLGSVLGYTKAKNEIRTDAQYYSIYVVWDYYIIENSLTTDPVSSIEGYRERYGDKNIKFIFNKINNVNN